ncbi:polyprenyl synthetase family protein [Streptomyces sp. NPDC052051]|uniref:polyprenyl synthetase family protein n=1 Tax=Streptomyces sp. NPDC052051 TaxID=3154649 RepID=UPI0034124C95
MKSYVDLHRTFAADIETEVTATLARLGPAAPSVHGAVGELLRHQRMKYPLSVLPLVVHGAETGSPAPALPLSAVHVLWWASACYLDDLADGDATRTPSGLGVHEALLAAIVAGHVLPLKALESPHVPTRVRGALAEEILDCAIIAGEGQLDDIRADMETMSRDSVVAAYRGKSGAPFGMITAMAGRLAGADDERTDLWREFGYVFGVLWQLFNDQEDITSGRNEDLLNGTVTYLLMCAVREASPEARKRILELHSAARTSAASGAALADLLLAPSVLARYERDIAEFRDDAYRILDKLGGDETHLSMLRRLVDQASGLYLRSPSAP